MMDVRRSHATSYRAKNYERPSKVYIFTTELEEHWGAGYHDAPHATSSRAPEATQQSRRRRHSLSH